MELLTTPIGGTPAVVETEDTFANVITELSAGHGPIAIDAERASGFRYSNRAYLIQIFRRGGGLHLIDPTNLRESKLINNLNDLLESQECVIHAASQDLPCLREFGILPKKIFDTELGARIAGCERVGLGPLCENLLEISLAKEHSAVDWSTRPLKAEWLDYAALDVAVLIDLRDKVEELLIESGKLDWAKAEFDSVLNAPPAKVRQDPWRRTSGMHQIKSRFELAIIRKLWMARDQIAAQIDLAPGRLLNDAVIVEIAKAKPNDLATFKAMPIMKERIRNDLQNSYLDTWWQILQETYSQDSQTWPEMRARGDSLPAPRVWREKFPISNAQLAHARIALSQIASSHNLPAENLISPEFVKRVIFNEGKELVLAERDLPKIESEVSGALSKLGAREWQIELTATAIARALCESEAPKSEPDNEGITQH